MDETPRRGPGAPKKKERKEHITISLKPATLQYIDEQSENRSEFIEQCVTEYRERKEK